MAEELLHRAEIGAALQKMAGERVTEHVRRDARRFDPGGKGKRLQLLAEALPGEMLASGSRGRAKARRSSSSFVGADGGEVGLQRRLRRLVQGTSRSRPPLPLMVSTLRRPMSTFRGSAISSDTRKPVHRAFRARLEPERASPRHALFRVLARVLAVSSSISTSASERIFGAAARASDCRSPSKDRRRASPRREESGRTGGWPRAFAHARSAPAPCARAREIGAEMVGVAVFAFFPLAARKRENRQGRAYRLRRYGRPPRARR